MTREEIRMLEEQGTKVTDIDSEGRIRYRTRINKSKKVCDSCEFLRLLDVKGKKRIQAFCKKEEREIATYSCAYEAENIPRPSWCVNCGKCK